jgi:chaperonin cofactor prefoldin
VIDKIRQQILTPGNLSELVRLVNEELDQTSNTLQSEVDVTEGNLADIEGRLERLYDAIESGGIDLNDLKPRIRELRGQQNRLLSRLAEVNNQLSERRVELASPEVVSRYVEDIRTLLSHSPLSERKAFIRSFVREVRVTGQEVLLTYTMPLSADGVTEEMVGVLPTVRYGGQYWTIGRTFTLAFRLAL